MYTNIYVAYYILRYAKNYFLLVIFNNYIDLCIYKLLYILKDNARFYDQFLTQKMEDRAIT